MRTERERGLEETVNHPDTSKDMEVIDVFSGGFKTSNDDITMWD